MTRDTEFFGCRRIVEPGADSVGTGLPRRRLIAGGAGVAVAGAAVGAGVTAGLMSSGAGQPSPTPPVAPTWST